jgi:hypothetical protein
MKSKRKAAPPGTLARLGHELLFTRDFYHETTASVAACAEALRQVSEPSPETLFLFRHDNYRLKLSPVGKDNITFELARRRRSKNGSYTAAFASGSLHTDADGMTCVQGRARFGVEALVGLLLVLPMILFLSSIAGSDPETLPLTGIIAVVFIVILLRTHSDRNALLQRIAQAVAAAENAPVLSVEVPKRKLTEADAAPRPLAEDDRPWQEYHR